MKRKIVAFSCCSLMLAVLPVLATSSNQKTSTTKTAEAKTITTKNKNSTTDKVKAKTAKAKTIQTKKPKQFKSVYRITGIVKGIRNNYTINSNRPILATLECIFINSSDKSENLNIWMKPSSVVPQQKIQLKEGSTGKPFQLIKTFYLKLRKKWWCRVYAPHEQITKWDYCAYFSLSDSDNQNHNPFSTDNTVPKTTNTTYHCRLKKPNKDLSFFFFKKKEPKKDVIISFLNF